MTEFAVKFGRGDNIVGVYHEPPQPTSGAPAALLLNAGLLHKVGPHRLNVDVARRLGSIGIPSLRFDMSGIGDSRMQDPDLTYVDRSQKDIEDAMALISERWGIQTFVVLGLCSGAFNALNIGVADTRVVGCVFLDGYSFPNLRFRLRHYAPRVLEAERWRRYLARKLGIGSAKGPSEDMAVFRTENIERQRYHDELKVLIDRGTSLLFVFTGGGPQPFNYESQLADVFPDLRLDVNSRILWMPESDHTYTVAGHRQRLMAEIEDWMRAEFVGARV